MQKGKDDEEIREKFMRVKRDLDSFVENFGKFRVDPHNASIFQKFATIYLNDFAQVLSEKCDLKDGMYEYVLLFSTLMGIKSLK